MSAIAGVLAFEAGRSDAPAALERMLAAMSHRARDAVTVRVPDPGVHLGHGLLRVLPEDGEGPSIPTAGPLTLTGDVRIDDRDGLLAEHGQDGAGLTDAQLVLASYQRTGPEAFGRLSGDFAVILWDSKAGRLVAARDHFGVKPLYYALTDKGLVLASEPKAILASRWCSPEIDRHSAARFAAELPPERESTQFRDIRRLPPAHLLVFENGRLRTECYWRLEPRELPPDLDHAAEFRRLLSEAVRRRMRSATPVAAMLSGGLDSSSIAAVAAAGLAARGGEPLRTISMVFDDTPDVNERPFIEAVLGRIRADATFVPSDDYLSLDGMDAILAAQDGPFLATGLVNTRRVYDCSARLGCRVLLDGHGGDEVVSFGHARLLDLARTGQWTTLWHELQRSSDLLDEPPWRRFLKDVRGAWRSGFKRKLRRLAPRNPAPSQVAAVAPEAPFGLAPGLLAGDPGLAAALARRREAEVSGWRSEQAYHLFLLDADWTAFAFETLDRVAAHAGVEVRYPFYDRHLVEFCVSLPSSAKFRDGWSRMVLREAMTDLLPPVVCWRRDKFEFGAHFRRSVVGKFDALCRQAIHARPAEVGAYLDLDAAEAAYARVSDFTLPLDGNDLKLVWRCVVLFLWLTAHRSASARQDIERTEPA